MKLIEKKKDLFTVDDTEYHLAHCIASDLRMGAGIAVPMCQKYSLRTRMRDSGESLDYPTCVYTEPVFNLITKKLSSGKPTYDSLRDALAKMSLMVIAKGVKKIAMPKIGCGLDGLQWVVVSGMIKQAFEGTDVEILVCVWR